MSILEILEAHTLAYDWYPCSCGVKWVWDGRGSGTEQHRAHVAQVLEEHELEREAAAKAEHRREWADHISEWHATVGAPICHVDAVVQALRSDHVPFGKGTTNGRD